MRDPFGGIGKPEPLKHLVPGVWSLLSPRNAQEASTVGCVVRDGSRVPSRIRNGAGWIVAAKRLH
jgi:hypothetical protein